MMVSVTTRCCLGMLVAAAIAAGCGGGSTEPTSTTTKTTEEDAGRPLNASGPQATVKELSDLLQSNAVPTAVLLYDRRIPAAIGRSRLVAALRQVQGSYTQLKLTVRGVRNTSGGTVVLARRTAPKAKVGELPLDGSYVLVKRGSEWRIAYDSFLSNVLIGIGRDEAQRRINPNAKKPSPRAVQSGLALQRRFDAVAASAGAGA
jgi:hypothetical protein